MFVSLVIVLLLLKYCRLNTLSKSIAAIIYFKRALLPTYIMFFCIVWLFVCCMSGNELCSLKKLPWQCCSNLKQLLWHYGDGMGENWRRRKSGWPFVAQELLTKMYKIKCKCTTVRVERCSDGKHSGACFRTTQKSPHQDFLWDMMIMHCENWKTQYTSFSFQQLLHISTHPSLVWWYELLLKMHWVDLRFSKTFNKSPF